MATPISYKKYNEPASRNKWTYTRRIQAIRELYSSKYRICSLHISLLNDVTVSFVLNARSNTKSDYKDRKFVIRTAAESSISKSD
jgi:hypothetical protein